MINSLVLMEKALTIHASFHQEQCFWLQNVCHRKKINLPLPLNSQITNQIGSADDLGPTSNDPT